MSPKTGRTRKPHTADYRNPKRKAPNYNLTCGSSAASSGFFMVSIIPIMHGMQQVLRECRWNEGAPGVASIKKRNVLQRTWPLRCSNNLSCPYNNTQCS